MASQVDPLIADSSDYVSQFDVAGEAEDIGNAIDIDLPAGWRTLHQQAPVLKGDPRSLLGLPGYNPYVIERDIYTLLSYKACAQALRDNQTFSSAAYMDYGIFNLIGQTIINKIGTDHRNLRAVSQPLFLQPKARGWWQTNWITDIANTLLSRLETMERADLNLELCARMPIHTVIRGIGVTSEKALNFRENLLRSIGMKGGTEEELAASPAEVQRMLLEVVVERRIEPREDIISSLLSQKLSTDAGERTLTDQEIVAYCQLIFLAGSATTWRQLGIVIHLLLTHYHFWEACRADRSLIPQAVEEAARWQGTQQVFPRLATKDAELDGVTIPAGARILVSAGAANRDPARWDRPDEFDIYREQKAHLGFGMGPHICLGMHVAKEEMVTALNGLMDRFPDMRLDPDVPQAQVIGALEQRGMSHVKVILR